MRKFAPAIAITAALLAAFALAGCGDASSTTSSESGDSPTTAAKSENGFYSDFGSFKAVEKTGTTDGVITLPDAKAGIVTSTFTGEGNFAIQALDASNQPTTDLIANTIGNYNGTAAYGLAGLGEAPKTLKVTGTGQWTIKISPVSSATTLPKTGSGDGVFKYAGPAATWKIANAGGEGNFAVTQYDESGMPNLAVNEIGAYTGSVPANAGPSIVTIISDGNWSLG
ncbi:hypothetical protein [Curtobacterium sp. 18060]|uniref:hypothetical protein n=1 Tax=Curtobacterium sp. 18060 TaxID=2681408 RepID=UPI00135771D9|nr:hypothetical protein [Curtobacterium sp. 18060]